jgi:hypothetical protein
MQYLSGNASYWFLKWQIYLVQKFLVPLLAVLV